MSEDAEKAHEGAAAAVDQQHPWLGLASFTEETRGFFHGREEEVAELGRRVQRKLLTILFGQSGLGKTSILRAGIVPRLRPEGYCPVYVRVDYSPDSPPPTEQIKQAIFRATEATGTWTQPGTAAEGESLWEFLHHRDDILKDANGKTVIPLLIFDQFEEIFTLAQADDAGRQRAAQFIADLADLVENRPPKALEAQLERDDTVTERFDFGRADYRILIALREDYLAHLEGLKGGMPSITQNRMRLARMNGQQALAAVTKPGGRLVSEEVAEAIVRFIAGGSELRNAEVEPSLLSLICRELNNTRIAQGRGEISADLLAGSHDTILAEFYERALADQPPAVRKAIEDELLTESGYRESLAEERVLKAFADAGAAPDALATLVNRRLLRIEERLDVRRVELTHDVLCGVVRASRGLRLEREAKEEAERQLAAQKAREEATRKALVRARQVAAGAATLAVIALVGAIFGYVNMNRAREAEANAQAARGQAEKLIVYLLDDFYRELEPIGRLDIVSGLAQRAIEYYRELPPVLHTPDTERNRALAQVRYGVVLRRQATLDKARTTLAESVKTFRRLQANGDQSEATILGLAEALATQSKVASLERDEKETLRLGDAALEVLRPLAIAARPSRPVMRLYAEMLESRGFNLHRREPEAAIKDLQLAREIYNKLGAQDLSNIPAAASYASSGYWLGLAYSGTGRPQEAQSVFEESLTMADRVIDVMPGHTTALYAKGNLSSRLAGFEVDELRMDRALALVQVGRQTWEGLLKIAPTNAVYRNNYGVTRGEVANILWQLGRFNDSRRERHEMVDMGEKPGDVSAFYMSNMMVWATDLAVEEAELGNRAGATQALAKHERFKESYLKMAPASIETDWWVYFADANKIRVALANGEPGEGVRLGIATLAKAESLVPTRKSHEVSKDILRYRLNLSVSLAQEGLRDHAAAEASAKRGLEAWGRLPPRSDARDERDRAFLNSIIAKAVARQGRQGEAAALIGPVIDYHRKQYARRHDHRWQHFLFADALYAGALAEPAKKRALLAEASAVLASLPPTMSGWKPLLQLRADVAAAR